MTGECEVYGKDCVCLLECIELVIKHIDKPVKELSEWLQNCIVEKTVRDISVAKKIFSLAMSIQKYELDLKFVRCESGHLTKGSK